MVMYSKMWVVAEFVDDGGDDGDDDDDETVTTDWRFEEQKRKRRLIFESLPMFVDADVNEGATFVASIVVQPDRWMKLK